MAEQLLYSIQIFSISVVIAYLLARVGFFSAPQGTGESSAEKPFWVSGLPAKKLASVVCVFTFISIYPVLISVLSGASVTVNTTMVGVALAGFLFGMVSAAVVAVAVSLLVIWAGGATVLPSIVAIFLAAVICSMARKRYASRDALLFGVIMGFLEIAHVLLILALVQPLASAKEIIYTTSFSMIIINACTVLVFVALISDLYSRDRLLAKEVATKSELGVARRIQMSLLSKDFSGDARYDFHALLTPAREVGGDLYAFSSCDKDRFVFILGDVSGKGMSAALTMSRTITLFQAALRDRQNRDEDSDSLVEAITAMLNDSLCENNSTQTFVTATIGCLELESGRYVYTSAGHPASYLCQAGRPAQRLERPKGPALGIIDGKAYASKSLQLSPGQYLLNYTDGISEAEDAELEQYGEVRIAEAFTDCAAFEDAQSVNEHLLASVKDFVGAAAQSDDIALCCLGWKPVQEDGVLDKGCAQSPDYAAGDAALATEGQPLSYRLPNTLPALYSLLEELPPALEALGVSGKRQDDLMLVIEELLSNIIKYGYPDKRAGGIELGLALRTAGGSGQDIARSQDTEQARLFDKARDAAPVKQGNTGTQDTVDVRTNDKVVIRDDGDPFDPRQAPAPDTGIGAKDRPIGGLGVSLVRKRVESFSYASSEGVNTLTCTMKEGGGA